MKKLINIVLLFLSFSLYSQTIASTQSHEGKVNALLSSETESSSDDSFYSVGNDGFIIKWTSDGMGDHYQVSDLQVRLVAKNPVYGDIAVYETDGVSNHRLTVIDSKTYTKKFSKKFANSIVSPAMEYKSEGYVMGVGGKMFTVAGPVLVYGISSSIIVGIAYLILG